MSSPWDLPVPEYLGLVVVFPAHSDMDTFTPDGFRVGDAIRNHLEIYAPAGLGSESGDTIRKCIGYVAPYKPGPDPAWAPDVFKDLELFFGGSHVVHSLLMEEDGGWKLDCTMQMGAEVKKKSFHAPSGHDLVLGQQVAEWIVEEGGFGFSKKQLKRFGEPLYGSKVVSSGDPLIADPYTEESVKEWEKILAKDPANLAARIFMARHVYWRDPGAAIGKLMPGAETDADLPMRHLAAYYLYRNADKTDEMLAEFRLLLAKQPGWMEGAGTFAWGMRRIRSRSPQFLEDLQHWFDRNPPTLERRANMAEFTRNMANRIRGGGFADTVRQQDWKPYHELAMKSADMYEEVLKEAPPIPWTCRNMIDVYAEMGTQEQFDSVIRRCLERYPDSAEIWKSVLNHMTAKWSRQHESAMNLIDQQWQHDPTNLLLGQLPWFFHPIEADLLVGYAVPPAEVKFCLGKYFKTEPRAKEQYLRGAAMMREHLGGAKGLAYEAYSLFRTGDSRPLQRALLEHPEICYTEDAYLPWSSHGLAFSHSTDLMQSSQKLLLLNGQFAELLPLAQKCRAMDERAELMAIEADLKAWNLNDYPYEADWYEGMARVMTGDVAGGRPMLESAIAQWPEGERYKLFAWVMAGIEPEATLARASEVSAAAPGDGELKAIHALALAKAGKLDEARKLAAEAAPDESWNWIGLIKALEEAGTLTK
ncbi:hypothetical protein HZA57_09475 [Candidatus Poribacteria bacterium]|nr:hypothetical protein [Candidatus Poribacteria bacterium]